MSNKRIIKRLKKDVQLDIDKILATELKKSFLKTKDVYIDDEVFLHIRKILVQKCSIERSG